MSIGVSSIGSVDPPLLYVVLQVPSGGVHVHETKLVNDGIPKPNGVATLVEKVDARLLVSLTKRSKATIRPTAPLQPVGSPNPVLYRYPSEEFNFGRCPTLPNHGDHRGECQPQELSSISSGR